MDSAGDFYVASGLNKRIEEFNSSGASVSYIDLSSSIGGPQWVAVNQSTGDVYATVDNVVEKFDSSGNYVTEFGNSAQAGWPWTIRLATCTSLTPSTIAW